jgi:hypothetical protein
VGEEISQRRARRWVRHATTFPVSSNNGAAFRAVFRQFVLLCSSARSVQPRTACRRRNPHQAVKNKDRNYTRGSLREFITDADERLSDYLERLDRRNAAGTTAVAPNQEPRKTRDVRAKRATLQGDAARPEYGRAYEGRRRLQRSDRGRRQQQVDCCGRSAAWRTDAWRRYERPARPSTIVLQQTMTRAFGSMLGAAQKGRRTSSPPRSRWDQNEALAADRLKAAAETRIAPRKHRNGRE